jgi:hypothetical protein
LAQVLVEAGTLRAGERFTIYLGDRRGGGPGTEVYDSTTDARLHAAVDRDGSGRYRELAVSPVRVRVTSDPRPDLLRVLGPSVVAPDEPFALHLAVFDRNRNVCEQYAGEVRLAAPPAVTGVPEAVRFGPTDQGIVIIEGMRVTAPGLYRIQAGDGVSGLRAQSNPTVCEAAPAQRLLWGDLHQHSWGDTTLGLMDEPSFKLHPARRHEQSRRVGRFDFAAPGPMSPPDQEDQPEIWRASQEAYRQNDAPGTYVPFLAFEAHPGRGGDRNVVFRDWSDGYISMRSPMEQVQRTYGHRDDVFLEAHVGGGPPDWEAFPTRRERLLEVASGHGSFEWVLQRALRHGHRPAVIGSSDAHLPSAGTPMAAHLFRGRWSRELNVRDTGFGSGPVAAVWAERCERPAIWQAISRRRTFATTGARIILRVSANGHSAGEEAQVAPPVEVRISANACAPVQRVDLIRNDRCLRSWFPGALDVELSHADARPLREGAYYVRLRQVDGEYAWSTPVWVHCPDGAPVPDESLPTWNAHEPVGLAALGSNEAAPHLSALRTYLEVEEDPGQFVEMTPVGLVDEVAGRAALFYAYYGPDRQAISIRWYFEFELPRIHLDRGWRDFGMRDERE